MSAPAVLPPTEALTTSDKQGRPARGWLICFIVFALYFTAALVLQRWSGVYESELSHYPDESAHVTTALMIRDYIAAGLPSTPMRYAEQYYVHYPKVGFGMWPPFFHSVAAVWMLLFQPSPASLLLFMATQCASLALIAAVYARRMFSDTASFGIGLLLIFVPLIQYETSMFMLDLMVALLELAALVFIVDYFCTERERAAIVFGIATAIAMLTKANANALVLVPVFLLFITRKFYLLRRRALYIAGVCVVLLGGPWQLISFRFLSASVPMATVNGSYVARVIVGYLDVFRHHLGTVVLGIAALGIGVQTLRLVLRGTGNSTKDIAIAGSLSLLLAILAFHAIVPTPADQRYMVPAIPLLLVFFVSGVQFIGTLKIGPGTPATRSVIVAIAAILSFGITAFAVPSRDHLGFRSVYEALKAPSYKVTLVCSDSLGEGALITQVAFGERRPDRYVLRSSKILSENMWFLTRYQPHFSDSKSLAEFLNTTVDAIVVDMSETLWPQDRSIILQAIQEHPESWQRLPVTNSGRSTRDIVVYKRLGAPLHADRRIRVPMQIMLGHDLHD